MTKHERQDLDSRFWQIGQRVARRDSDELGTIVHADGEIKVKWDRGRTSYYRRGVPANVQLTDDQEAEPSMK
jgi:hypothetical protein